MRTRLTRQPGQPGTKQLLAQYGAQLICVWYRYDESRGRRLKTVELVVEETPYTPAQEKYQPQSVVEVQVGYEESEAQ